MIVKQQTERNSCDMKQDKRLDRATAKAFQRNPSRGNPCPCAARRVAGMLVGAVLLLAGTAVANEPLEWIYDTSGRSEGVVAASDVPATESFVSVLAFMAWSIGFDLDTTSGFCVIFR